MANTPTPPKGQNVETETYKTPAKNFPQGGSKASYTPSANINPLSYGKDGGKASFNDPPAVVVGGACEVAPVPAMPGTLVIGEDKNVSTPVSG